MCVTVEPRAEAEPECLEERSFLLQHLDRGIHREPEIQIDRKKIDFVATPRLLGVTLDRQLTFGTHVENVTKAAISSNRMLSALAHSSYGWRKQWLTTVYIRWSRAR